MLTIIQTITRKVKPMKWNIHFYVLEGKYMSAGNALPDDPSLIFSFRLLDDDGEIYFLGNSSALDFDPLDFYGEAFGCTEMQFLNEYGEWEVL